AIDVALDIDRHAVGHAGLRPAQIGEHPVGVLRQVMLPPPEGVWGMPLELLRTLPSYDPDVAKNRADARNIMRKLGFGPDNRLQVKLITRNVPAYRDPAVILISQLNEIYINAELDVVDTVQWYPKIMRKDFAVGLNV